MMNLPIMKYSDLRAIMCLDDMRYPSPYVSENISERQVKEIIAVTKWETKSKTQKGINE